MSAGRRDATRAAAGEGRGIVAVKQGKMPAEVVLRRAQLSRGRKWEAVQRSKTAEIIGLNCLLSALVHVPAG